MFKLFMSILLILGSRFSFAAVDVCVNDAGKMQCGSGEIAYIDHLGNVSLSGTHVLGQMKVTGNVEANHAEVKQADITGNVDVSSLVIKNNLNLIGKFNSSNSTYNGTNKITGDLIAKNDIFAGPSEIVGDVKLSNSVFKSTSEFVGILQASFTQFESPIHIYACKAIFNHSISTNVLLGAQKNCSDNNTQVIYVSDQSKINGDIQFLGKNGKVYLSKNSSISGRILGGTVIRE